MSMKFEKIKSIIINDDDLITYIKMGNCSVIRYLERRNTEQYIRKLDKDHYLILATGEVIESNHTNNRSESKKYLSVSFRKLRDLINTNVTYPKRCKLITLTYKENMTDIERLKKDFRNFIDKFRRKYGNVEYIDIREPQARGAWHHHCILIFPKKAPFILNDDLSKIWNFGITKTQAIDENIDNLGAYFTAHLSDIPIEEIEDLKYSDKDIKEIWIENNKKLDVPKRYIKGARLHLYPTGFNIYLKSKGVKNPVKENITYKEAKEKIGLRQPIYSEAIKMSDTDKDFTNIIAREYYNTKRNKKN